jgi:hypothetical protein
MYLRRREEREQESRNDLPPLFHHQPSSVETLGNFLLGAVLTFRIDLRFQSSFLDLVFCGIFFTGDAGVVVPFLLCAS